MSLFAAVPSRARGQFTVDLTLSLIELLDENCFYYNILIKKGCVNGIN
jgi:hypothetical protein